MEIWKVNAIDKNSKINEILDNHRPQTIILASKGVDSPTETFANFRLDHRILRNSITVTHLKKYREIFSSNRIRVGEKIALYNTEITRNGARVDLVRILENGSYKNIIGSLKLLPNSNRLLIDVVKSIIKGSEISSMEISRLLKSKWDLNLLHSFIFLLFVCETELQLLQILCFLN